MDQPLSVAPAASVASYLELSQRVMIMSLETMKIVKSIPSLDLTYVPVGFSTGLFAIARNQGVIFLHCDIRPSASYLRNDSQ